MTQRMAMALTVLNLLLVAALISERRPIVAQSTPDVVRARAWELLDDRGRVRARMNVEESGTAVLRLTDRHGTIRVKLGADEDGSGLVLLNGSTEVGVHLVTNAAGSHITLANADGREQRIEPR